MHVINSFTLKIDGKVYAAHQPNISGADILAFADKQPQGNYALFLILEDGDMEEIRLTEVVDLQRTGVEEFLTFKTDVIYRLSIDNQSREWGASTISGKAIKRLSGQGDTSHLGVWQITQDGEKKLIRDRDHVNLACEGIEKFHMGAEFSICIEGKTFEWPKNTITTEEIIQLGGWDASQGAVEVDNDQNERPLALGEVIHLKPGHNFCKRQRFKRGYDQNSRIGQELTLLRKNFESVDYKEENNLHWFKINAYLLPLPLSPEKIAIVFSVTVGHPVTKPYGFYVPDDVKHNDKILSLSNPQHQPPFDGSWRFVSWDQEDWMPGADVTSGSNLWGWARSFRARLLEGE